MVKSKRTKYFYFQTTILALLILYIILINILIAKGISKWGINLDGFIMIIILLLILILATQKFNRDSNIIIVDKESKIISFTNFFWKTKTSYHFEDLDGYVTGRFIGKYRSLTKVIWIVKEKKMVKRINENYVKNIVELETELKELKYLGYQSITKMKRIRMIFMKLKIDEV